MCAPCRQVSVYLCARLYLWYVAALRRRSSWISPSLQPLTLKTHTHPISHTDHFKALLRSLLSLQTRPSLQPSHHSFSTAAVCVRALLDDLALRFTYALGTTLEELRTVLGVGRVSLLSTGSTAAFTPATTGRLASMTTPFSAPSLTLARAGSDASLQKNLQEQEQLPQSLLSCLHTPDQNHSASAEGVPPVELTPLRVRTTKTAPAASPASPEPEAVGTLGE